MSQLACVESAQAVADHDHRSVVLVEDLVELGLQPLNHLAETARVGHDSNEACAMAEPVAEVRHRD